MVKEIELTRDQVALVDDDDYPTLVKSSWYALSRHNHWYAVTSSSKGGPTTVYMHRVIMDAPKGMQVDHINHNGLDNRRRNLRLCTHAENLRNRRDDNTTNGNKNKLVQARLTQSVYEAVARLAEKYDLSIATILRWALVEYIEREGDTNETR